MNGGTIMDTPEAIASFRVSARYRHCQLRAKGFTSRSKLRVKDLCRLYDFEARTWAEAATRIEENFIECVELEAARIRSLRESSAARPRRVESLDRPGTDRVDQPQ